MTGARPDAFIRPEARPAWQDLCAALEVASQHGIYVPCQEDPVAFQGDDPGVRFVAARACAVCPIHRQCDTFAKANHERVGVWGGRDRDATRLRACSSCGRPILREPDELGRPKLKCDRCAADPRCARCDDPIPRNPHRRGRPKRICDACRGAAPTPSEAAS